MGVLIVNFVFVGSFFYILAVKTVRKYHICVGEGNVDVFTAEVQSQRCAD